MTAEALLFISRRLEGVADEAMPNAALRDYLLELSRFAKKEAGLEPVADDLAPPTPVKVMGVECLRKGDVVCRWWQDGTPPPFNDVFQVLYVHRKERKVTAVAVDGTQITLRPWNFSHRWPREVARKLSIPWRYRITW